MSVHYPVAGGPLADLLFNEPGVGRCLVAADGTVLATNRDWLRYVDASAGTEHPIGNLADYAFASPALLARARAGERLEIPAHIRQLQGVDTWWEGSLTPVPMDQATGLLVTVREIPSITEQAARSRSETAVRDSEARYRSLFTSMTEGFALGEAIRDETGRPSDFRFLEMNEAFERQSGLRRDATAGRSMRELLPHAEQSWIEVCCGVAFGEPARRFENYNQYLDRHFSVYCFSPQPGYFAILFTDVTEQRKSEAALKAAHDTFRHLVEESPFGVYVVDADFRLVQVSAGAQKVFQNVRPLLGRDFADVLRTIWTEPFATEAINRFRHTLATGEAYHSPSTVETRHDIPVVESYDWKIERIALPDGRYGVVCHFYDLSERQRYEAVLHAKTQQIESLLTNAPLGLAFFDREHRYVQINEELAAINGIAAADHIGRTIEDLLPVNAQTVVPVVDRVFSTGEAVDSLEVAGETPRDPGVPRHWLTGFYPVRDKEGAVVLVGAWIIEITARKRAEQDLQQADRRKNDFLAMLSHELRNPLAPIRTGVHLLELAPPGSPQAGRALAIIRRQSDHLARLVDDLLDITRISRGKIELRKQPLDLRDIARRAADDLRSTFEEGEVRLEVDVAGDPVWIDGDATRISQVLGNLLQNSLKFTPSGGTVTVRLTTAEDQARLLVRDTGIGMEPALIEQMFEPFEQGEHGLARTKGGLGLGLALVRGLVELHGGSVKARSAGPGSGAEFIVTLPLSSATRFDAPHREAASAEESRLIVLVEDNVDAALVLADMLEMHGHRVHVAHDARSGLALLRDLRPDVLVCDLGLPDVDGFEVARKVRAAAEGRDVRLIALSGHAQPEDLKLAHEAGFDVHLAKPPAPDELLQAVTR